jgi:hypothetical protein
VSAGRVTACKAPGCGAMIRWLYTEKRNAMPLDEEPHPDGNVVLVKVGHETLARVLGGADLPAQQTAYRAHWATCPGSDAMRAQRARALRREIASGPVCEAPGCGQRMHAGLARREGWREHPACDTAARAEHEAAVAARRAGAA